ncbi:MAG: hypothetical protein R3E96_12470 [Planctomycetota bacterium]
MITLTHETPPEISLVDHEEPFQAGSMQSEQAEAMRQRAELHLISQGHHGDGGLEAGTQCCRRGPMPKGALCRLPAEELHSVNEELFDVGVKKIRRDSFSPTTD